MEGRIKKVDVSLEEKKLMSIIWSLNWAYIIKNLEGLGLSQKGIFDIIYDMYHI